jgi:hypothetical protein
MTVLTIPRRHWRSYGSDPLPTGEEALDEPFRAFPSWFLRVTCERCGKERMIAETHTPQAGSSIRDIIDHMRHDGCGGRASKVELISGIDGASSRPIRRIVLRQGRPQSAWRKG